MEFEPSEQKQPPAPRNSDRLYLVLALAAFAAAVVLIVVQNRAFSREFRAYFSSMPVSRPKAEEPTRLVIDFGNDTKRAFKGRIEPGMTILSALRASQDAGKFKVRTDDRGRVVEIAGIGAAGPKEWRISLNGADISDLPGHIEVRPGDRILFRYE